VEGRLVSCKKNAATTHQKDEEEEKLSRGRTGREKADRKGRDAEDCLQIDSSSQCGKQGHGELERMMTEEVEKEDTGTMPAKIEHLRKSAKAPGKSCRGSKEGGEGVGVRGEQVGRKKKPTSSTSADGGEKRLGSK